MRTDIHRPADFDPSDYRVVDYLDNKHPVVPLSGHPLVMEQHNKRVQLWQERVFKYFPNFKTGGTDHQSISQCNHCGHPGIRWVAVVEHTPTGKFLAFGEICANRCDLPGIDAFRAKYVKTQAQREDEEYDRWLAAHEFRLANVEVCGFLDSLDAEDAHPFLADMKRVLDRYGRLSERQMESTMKFKAGAERREAAKQAEQELLANADPLLEGRRPITGTVVSTKWQSSMYGDTFKMLVKQDDGNKVWGTVPAHMLTQVEKGKRVVFTATVERSADDKHFGFYSRPSGGGVISEEIS